MKKQILHNFFALFLFTSAILFAQTEEHPWQFSFGFNAVDTFSTDAIGQGNLFEEFFNIGDHWNIAPYPSPLIQFQNIEILLLKTILFSPQMPT